jgi:glycosyltransferase involved in cell wall biosynthesis
LEKPLSILVLTDIFFPDTPGGANRMVYYVSRGLAEDGHQVRVLTSRPRADTPLREFIGRLDVRRYDLKHSSGGGPLLGAMRIIQTVRRACDDLVREAPVDVVSIQQPLPGYAATLSKGLRKVPFSYGFHSPWSVEYDFKVQNARNSFLRWVGWYLLNSRTRRFLERKTIQRSRNVVLLSEFSQGLIEQIHRFPKENILCVPGAVDESRYTPTENREGIRKRFGLPVDRPLLLTVRNLRQRMGLGRLVDAMSLVVKEIPSVFLVIGGKGPLKEELEAQTRRLGLEASISFPGFLNEEDLPAHYSAADFFVLPTEFLEGFGMVTLEALACGTPVLGTPVGATPEILKPLDESFLFADSTPEAMAASIVRHVRVLQTDPAGYRSSRDACFQYVRDRFSMAQMISGWSAALRSAAGK